MKQTLFVIINDKKQYYAGDIWWATYFTEAKYFINRELAKKELKDKKLDGKIHWILINPIIDDL